MDDVEAWTDGAVIVRARREGPGRWSSFDVVIPASRQDVWKRLTTPAGMRTFFAPEANVELREGGAWEALFFPGAPPGQRGAEGVYFKALDPPRSFTVQWNAPPQFPEVRNEGFPATFELEPIDHATTRVRLRLHGFKQGGQWDGTYEYFLDAWALVLNRLRRSDVEGPIDWAAESGGRAGE